MSKINIFVIYDTECVYSVVKANSESELKSKLNTVFDGIRNPIERVELPSFDKILNYNEQNFDVIFENDEGFEEPESDRAETFQIIRQKII